MRLPGQRRREAQSGQVLVETAITMPLFLFIMLGMFQLMLMHQARYLTKYAAYKAARAGALRRADKGVMEKAAMAVLLPMVGRDTDYSGLYKTDSAGNYATGWAAQKNLTVTNGVSMVEVTVCNPTSGMFDSSKDFDDPKAVSGALPKDTTNSGDGSDSDGSEDPPPDPPPAPQLLDWKGFDSSKLMVQVTFYYRMFVPFANGVLWWMVYGQENRELLRTLRVGEKPTTHRGGLNGKDTTQELYDLAQAGKYILPIRASYAVRMMSNVKAGTLPSRNHCQVPWKKKD